MQTRRDRETCEISEALFESKKPSGDIKRGAGSLVGRKTCVKRYQSKIDAEIERSVLNSDQSGS